MKRWFVLALLFAVPGVVSGCSGEKTGTDPPSSTSTGGVKDQAGAKSTSGGTQETSNFGPPDPTVAPTKVDPKDYKELPGGLKYAILKPGKGDRKVQAGQQVSVHYTGWTQDTGEKFDSSYDRGTPYAVTLEVNLIGGWNQGIPGMKVGEKRRLVVPPALGYGATGKDPIPPNATLVFDIELVSIDAPPQ